MIRGTTPPYSLAVDFDLIGWTCFVTLKGLGSKLDLEGDRLTVTAGEQEGTSDVSFRLTQKETLAFKAGRCDVQLRAIKNGIAIATDIAELRVGPILMDGEIHE